MYWKGLTKQELIDMGITEIRWNRYLETWVITREWYKNNSKTIRTKYNVIINSVFCRHKYGKDKSYPKVQFNYKNKPYCFPLSRVVYAWFVEDIPDGYVIDHIDNDPYNNMLTNLQMLTIEDNLRKRFEDLDDKCFNQYRNTNKR